MPVVAHAVSVSGRESLVAWRGRKRKPGHRKPCGQLKASGDKAEREADDRIRASRQPHRRELRRDVAGNEIDRFSEKAESPLGRLNLRGLISDAQHDAAVLYAGVVGRYRAVIEAPRATGGSGRGLDCAAASADPVEKRVRIGGAIVAYRVWPCGSNGNACACAARKADYDGAFAAVMAAGQRAAKAVARALHGEAATQELVYLDAGLAALAAHFGLTARRRRDDDRNAH